MLGVAGQVQRVFNSGCLRVKFSRLHVWTICAEAVVKVTKYIFPEDRVLSTIHTHRQILLSFLLAIKSVWQSVKIGWLSW